MNKRSVHIIILVLSIILILSVTISYMQENTDIYDKKEVSICVDHPIPLDEFIKDVKVNPNFTEHNKTTIKWLESLKGNYIVFPSEDAYFILTESDAVKLPIRNESHTTIYDICDCYVKEKKSLGPKMNKIILISDVDFITEDEDYIDID